MFLCTAKSHGAKLPLVIRTSLSLIGFAFTIFQLSLALIVAVLLFLIGVLAIVGKAFNVGPLA